MYRALHILAMVLLLSASASASDSITVVKELERVSSVLAKSNSYSAKITYKMYRDAKSTQVLEQQQAMYYKQGNKFRFEIENSLIIQNSELFFLKDDESETLLLMKPNQDAPSQLLNVDKISAKVAKLKVIKSSATELLVDLVPKDESYEKVRLLIDIEKHYIKKAILYYSNAVNISEDYQKEELVYPRLEIEYTEVKINATLSTEIFSTTSYIKKSGKIYATKPEYQQYELIDQTHF
jgi:hypothetical protein